MTFRIPRTGALRLRRPMTDAPYGFDIDHPGSSPDIPYLGLLRLCHFLPPRSSPRKAHYGPHGDD
ncbi:uncharacterized protein N7484_008311 [Penicillium longicatenatum]|uniref:uncharacterized protein n=1 Tax=Penicillium longicatenatum TaxID=1561947 RepID=UPI002547FAB7|nr:uncharacterized protein N7484_008311 [Penicillium longicatenatum]KAJ5634998.1 hypothetical protein N7484_008311 [Penicillium longicatenatum]